MKHFRTIPEYCQGIQIKPPKYTFYDIRSFEENMPTVVRKMEPFRHEFYAIAIKAGGTGVAKSGHFTRFPTGSVIFFNSPFQILSWDILPDWQGYYVMFTQEFISRSALFRNLLIDFPFLRMDQSVPFEIDEDDLEMVSMVFHKIYREYYGDNEDKFPFIEAFTNLLLLYIKRCYAKHEAKDNAEKELRTADLKLVTRFQTLIETSFFPANLPSGDFKLHSPSFYAEQLHVHPNHLNATVKKITGKTALQFIHHHVLQLAKSYLLQTDLSIKEIAYELQFDSPNHFSTFFKKNTGQTPNQFKTSS